MPTWYIWYWIYIRKHSKLQIGTQTLADIAYTRLFSKQLRTVGFICRAIKLYSISELDKISYKLQVLKTYIYYLPITYKFDDNEFAGRLIIPNHNISKDWK
jgi:hypothetical protein